MDDASARTISANPMRGPNKLKLGVFNINCNGGLTISLAPERWKADWPDVVKATVMADEAGFDFILPVAKWHGYGGKSNNLHRSFETLTHGAALGARQLDSHVRAHATPGQHYNIRPAHDLDLVTKRTRPAAVAPASSSARAARTIWYGPMVLMA